MQKPEPAPAPAYPIASVDNALRLLVLFRDRPRVRLSEASEYLGVAHSTAHRLMAMLAFHGFVRQEADSRAYVAGPVLTEIGLAAVRELDIRRHARPALEQLAASLGETVHLAVLEGDTVRYLDAVESPRALRVAARTGTTLAAGGAASGRYLTIFDGGGCGHAPNPPCDSGIDAPSMLFKGSAPDGGGRHQRHRMHQRHRQSRAAAEAD